MKDTDEDRIEVVKLSFCAFVFDLVMRLEHFNFVFTW